jgi:HEAT repeats/zinc-ribbon domain/PBS lyase HEAT-like repeat
MLAGFFKPNIEKLKAKGDVLGLTQALGHKDARVRMDAANALGTLQDARAVEPLAAALQDDDQYVRCRAAEALGRIGDASAVEPLIVSLGDPLVRQVAIGALGELGNVRAVEPLIAALKDDDPFGRSLAAEALGKIGDPRAIEPLIATQKVSDGQVGSTITWALGKIADAAPALDKRTSTNSYHNQKWILTLAYPPDWEIVWENEPDGEWEIIVGVAGKPSRSGRPSVTIRILPHAVISFRPADIVTAAGGTGMPMELPRTPQEYNQGCKRELQSALPGVRFISEETGTLAGMPAATLVYSYTGRYGTIREKQINLFGPNVTYRLLSEAPVDQAKSTDQYFDEVVASFRPVTEARTRQEPATVTSCPECGNPVSDSAVRCHKCGHRFV